MPAEVESMFYVREKPWHGLGTRVEEALTSAEALKKAGLDWTVRKEPIYYKDEETGSFFTVRDTDEKLLGIGVSDRYTIVQNNDAFSFVDNLVDNSTIYYETAGSLFGGKKIWLLAKMPEVKIMKEKVDPYICFTNTHDGSGAIRVCMTPIRVVCNNTLNLALSKASRSWSARHTGDLQSKIHSAQESLDLAETYMNNLGETLENFADIDLTDDDIEEIFNCVYPIVEEDEDKNIRKRNNIERIHKNFMYALDMPDISKYRNTAFGVINAASDFLQHAEPIRKTPNYIENRFGNIIQGTTDLDKFYSVLNNYIK